jgi:SAM-dependent methyltransferase
MDIVEHNRRAWDREVERGNKWTLPVTPEDIAAARQGRWHIVLTPIKPVPRDWFPADLAGVRVLCLASGGGQQGPLLAAAGARVTVLDNSPRQLEQDRAVAERESLELGLVQGDMADLGAFADGEFELIVHPVSNLFVPDVRPVWNEAFRVLAPGGALLAGFASPAQFIFADPWGDEPALEVTYALPYDERTSISEDKRQQYIDGEEPLIFSHTLDDQIGGQIAAGLVIAGFYEDGNPDQRLARYMPTFMATRAVKPAGPLAA